MGESPKDRRSMEEVVADIAAGRAIPEERIEDFYADPSYRAALAEKDPSALFALIEDERMAPEVPDYPGIAAMQGAAAKPRRLWKWYGMAASLALAALLFFGRDAAISPGGDDVPTITGPPAGAARVSQPELLPEGVARRHAATHAGLLVETTYTPGLRTIQYESSGGSGLRLTMVIGAEL